MTPQPDRRTMLKLAAASAAAVFAWPAAAGPTGMDGIVTFAGDQAIPEGSLKIYLEDITVQDESRRRLAETRLVSDGQATSLPFVLSPPIALNGAAVLDVVVRLEQPDGWLIARGSARLTIGTPVTVMLNTVSY
jgi:hypothetical protein